MSSGQIYLIECDGNHKIGFTTNLSGRLHTFTTSNAKPIHLLGVIPGSRELELQIHSRLAPHRLRGEWYRNDPAVLRLWRALLIDPVEALRPARSVRPTVSVSSSSSIATEFAPWKAMLAALNEMTTEFGPLNKHRPDVRPTLQKAAAKYEEVQRFVFANDLEGDAKQVALGWQIMDGLRAELTAMRD